MKIMKINEVIAELYELIAELYEVSNRLSICSSKVFSILVYDNLGKIVYMLSDIIEYNKKLNIIILQDIIVNV